MALDNNSAYKEADLLDVNSGATYPLILGREIWMPTLWVGSAELPVVADGADPDSCGAWNTPAIGEHTEEFSIKIQKFWNLRNRLNIALVGSSRVKSGVDPSLFTSGKALNWSFSGNEAIGARRIVENYLLPQSPRLQVVLLNLMPGWLFWRREVVWQDIRLSKGYRYDEAHSFWSSGVPSDYLNQVAGKSWSLSPYFDSLGGRDYGPGGNWGSEPIPYMNAYAEAFEEEPFASNWADLVATIELCDKRRIHVILVNFPQSPLYANTPVMGKYGPSWAAWHELSRRVDSLQVKYPYLHYYDAHRNANHDFPESCFGNEDHLNHNGAILMTARLDSMIKTYRLREIPD